MSAIRNASTDITLAQYSHNPQVNGMCSLMVNATWHMPCMHMLISSHNVMCLHILLHFVLMDSGDVSPHKVSLLYKAVHSFINVLIMLFPAYH